MAVEITTTPACRCFGGTLALEHGGAQLFQPVGDLERLASEPRTAVAQRHQHLGDAGHADAADADEMNGAHLPGSLVAAFIGSVPTRSAGARPRRGGWQRQRPCRRRGRCRKECPMSRLRLSASSTDCRDHRAPDPGQGAGIGGLVVAGGGGRGSGDRGPPDHGDIGDRRTPRRG